MYGNNKKIEDVLKYLYQNKQEDLARTVLDLIRANERANQQPIQPLIAPPKIWYGDNTNPLQPPYTITCEVGNL